MANRGLAVLRLLTLAGYFSLLLLLVLWATWLSPPAHLPIAFVLLVGIGPLLIPLRGILHGRAYTHAWASMLLLLYFTHGIVEAWSSPALRNLALWEIALSILTLSAMALYARQKARADRAHASNELADKGNG